MINRLLINLVLCSTGIGCTVSLSVMQEIILILFQKFCCKGISPTSMFSDLCGTVLVWLLCWAYSGANQTPTGLLVSTC